MAVQVIFSFDSEDYETPAADDAEKWWAEAMTRHGITACICIVGELARALRERGRRDVVEAMQRHEIAFHSDLHSAHPTWAEYLDECGWDDGVARVLREEGRGIGDVRDVFGQHPSAWCKPGASWGPQVAHAMDRMNVPLFCDAPFEAAPGRPLWYAGTLCTAYHLSFDRYFSVPHDERVARMQADFERKCAEHDGGYLTMYTHPCRLVTSRFTDTFTAGMNPPRESWGPSPLRPDDEIAGLKRDFDAFLAWVVRRPDVELTTYRRLFAGFAPGPAPWLTAGELQRLARRAPERRHQPVDGGCLSPAEQFGALARAAAVLGQTGRPADGVPVRRLLGPTQTPPDDGPSGTVTAADVLAAAGRVDDFCTSTGQMPASIPLGSRQVGPGAFLQAVSRVIGAFGKAGRLPDSVELQPVPSHPAIAEREDFLGLKFQGGWSIFAPEFEGRCVLEMIRLQSWTAKPAVR